MKQRSNVCEAGMLRQFIRNISIYGILPVVGKFLNFLLVLVYAKVFTPEQYGMVDLLEAMVFFLLIVASLEIPTAMGRYFYDKDTLEHKQIIINTSLVITVVFALIIICLTLLFRETMINLFLNELDQAGLLYIAMFWLFTLAVNTFLSFIPRYDNRPKVYVAVGVISILVKLLFSLLFVLVWEKGLSGVLYGYICGNIASIFMYSVVSWHYFKPVFSWKYAGKLMVYALPLLLGSVFVEVWKPWLRHLMIMYYPVAVVGFYAFSIRLTSVNMIVHGAFKTAWKPLLFEKKDDFVRGGTMKRVSGLVALVSIIMGCMIACYAKEATILIGSRDYLDSVQITGLLAVSGIFQMMCELRGFGPYIDNRTYVVTIANVLAFVVSSVFMMLVKDSMGLFGIGYACIIYNMLCYLILVLYTRIRYRIALHNMWEIPLVLLLAVCVFLSANMMQLRFRIAASVVSVLFGLYIFFSHYYKLNLKLRAE